MFDRIKRSFDLVRASVRVLRRDRRLLWFPLISALALVLLVAAFALPLFGVAGFDGMACATMLAALLLVWNATVVPPVLVVAFGLVVVLALATCVLFHATLSGIYAAVLYRYAVDGDAAPGFDRAALAASFRDKS